METYTYPMCKFTMNKIYSGWHVNGTDNYVGQPHSWYGTYTYPMYKFTMNKIYSGRHVNGTDNCVDQPHSWYGT